MQKIAIYGAGGLGRETRLLIEQINEKEPKWEFLGYFDDDPDENIKNILGDLKTLNNFDKPIQVVIAIADGKTRKKLVEGIYNSNVEFATLIHPGVIYHKAEVKMGSGVIITANNVLTTNIILEDFVIVNLSCTVGHDSKIGAYSSIMPGAHISGNVKIGTETLIGTGAQILQNLTIGNGCQVGAGAVVTTNVIDGATVVGVPAKPINK